MLYTIDNKLARSPAELTSPDVVFYNTTYVCSVLQHYILLHKANCKKPLETLAALYLAIVILLLINKQGGGSILFFWGEAFIKSIWERPARSAKILRRTHGDVP